MARKRKTKKLPKERNLIAIAAFQRSGGGKHKNRTKAVARGSSRKSKHKKGWE